MGTVSDSTPDGAESRRDVDPEPFLVAFDAFAQAIRRARGAPAGDGGNGLTLSFSQYALIRALAGREAARIGDLADDAAVTPSTATRILDVLERRALVRRDRAPEDRRAVSVSLTERGRDELRRQDAWMRGHQRAFFAALPQVEQALAPDLLVRLAGLIAELAGGPAGSTEASPAGVTEVPPGRCDRSPARQVRIA